MSTPTDGAGFTCGNGTSAHWYQSVWLLVVENLWPCFSTNLCFDHLLFALLKLQLYALNTNSNTSGINPGFKAIILFTSNMWNTVSPTPPPPPPLVSRDDTKPVCTETGGMWIRLQSAENNNPQVYSCLICSEACLFRCSLTLNEA